MGYLIDSLVRFIEGVERGRIQLAPHVAEQLVPELEKVQWDDDGGLILDTCSPFLRSTVRAFDRIDRAVKQEDSAPSTNPEPIDPAWYTRELFDALETIFHAMTNRPSAEFVRDDESFGEAIRRYGGRLKNSPREARSRMEAAERATTLVGTFYRQYASRVLPSLRHFGGSKLVLGGKQSFSDASLDAVRSMLLYADTILIPDPVLPWFEVERTQEAFGQIRMIESAWYLLRLKPLVDAGLGVPPIIVFPSWEKVMEADDVETQRGIENDFLAFFSYYLDSTFEDISELARFARNSPQKVLLAAERHRLFVPQGGEIGMSVSAAIQHERKEVARWRSVEFQRHHARYSDAQIVCSSIMERLVPLYHLSENATSLRGSPMLSLDVRWHFANLRSRVRNTAAVDGGLTDTKTLALLQVLENGPTRWLGNVGIDDLVELRRAGANAEFRSRMARVSDRLGSTDVSDLGRVAGEIEREFRGIVDEHDAEARKIRDRYSARNASFLSGAVFSAAASLTPWLPTVAPAVAGAGALAALVSSGTAQLGESRQLRRTLLGVLAASARKATAKGG